MKVSKIFPLLLAAVLQVAPMIRSALPQLQAIAPSGWAIVLKLSAGAVAMLTYHTVSAASDTITSPGTASAVTGHTYTATPGTAVYTMTASPYLPGGWTVSPNPPAPGLSVAVDGSGIYYWVGNPTTPGTYNVTIVAYEFGPTPSGPTSDPKTVVLTVTAGAPSAPTGVSATAASTNQINLSWTDAANETSYKIQQAITTNGPWAQVGTVGANVTTYSATGLNPSTTYYFQVVASNSGGNATNSNPVFATTVNLAPVLSAIGSKSVTATSNLTFTATATDTGENSTNIISDFESFANNTANGSVLFRDPKFSTNTTTPFLDATATYSTVTNTFPAGHASTRVLVSRWGFATGTTAPWLRLATTSPANLPNPVVNLNGQLRFDIYTSANIKLGLGLRETNSNFSYGGDGGTNGLIEWSGVSGTNANSSGQATPNPTRTISAGSWQTVQFNIPTESTTAFTGDGIISTTTGKGVLEHLAILPSGSTGNFTNYFDNFAIINTNQVFYRLDAGAPAGATINLTNGVFNWTPSTLQTGLVTFAVIATDNGVPNMSATQSVTVTVSSINAAPNLPAIPNKTVLAGNLLTFTNTATDTDFPAQTITYSLGAGFPTGAAIGSSGGVFTWTPTVGQIGITNLSIVATDNGSPPLSSTQNVSITVNPNTAPSLTATPDQYVEAGRTLTITNVASDSDVPAQTLTFTLGVGAPAGAGINPSTGVLTWPTGNNDPAGTNAFTVIVTDNGTPNLSANRTFNAIVVPRKMANGGLDGSGNITLTWSTIPGRTYHVMYKVSFNDPAWLPFGSDLLAVGTSLSTSVPTSPDTSRFYQIFEIQ